MELGLVGFLLILMAARRRSPPAIEGGAVLWTVLVFGLLLQFAGGIEGILLFMMGFMTLLWDYSRVFVRSWSGELTS
jgi:hypothetical protein